MTWFVYLLAGIGAGIVTGMAGRCDYASAGECVRLGEL